MVSRCNHTNNWEDQQTTKIVMSSGGEVEAEMASFGR